ncbi:signal peptidase 22 kDa subunit [Choiromyces venosus 120613-1]|uniref:Signal peptidase subunit 3 n=1 Tax=Choiromyces venosus 120613-1 TaxID=1336337 RepID=A0A3N4JZJ7_9PEZI|nr:signal peptidase 22 kDa subunit [Choiromyces venosus 120613-1]
MHSILTRFQNVFGFLTTVAFFVASLVAITSLLYPADVKVGVIKTSDVKIAKGRAHQYYTSKVQEYAVLRFDLEADLSSLFNWNTKQVFAYVSASYPGSKYTTNEAVIWDTILPSHSASKLILKNERAKYSINDITGKFAGRENVTLAFHWNVQPHVGRLTWGNVGITEGVNFPQLERAGGKKAAAAK